MMNSAKTSVYYCCVCRKNSRDHNNLNLSFFRFPKDENRFAEWKKIVQCEKLAMYSAQYCYDHFRICSLHFEEPAFAGMLKSRLKKKRKTIYSSCEIKHSSSRHTCGEVTNICEYSGIIDI
ncbi:uncharacterized protein [Diabrotica undecimpunctata]|uniref:uncharacterized protein n=1 Tax=Diabrotica undecimpunctata TaxID=50387 RepID=UPI003B632348